MPITLTITDDQAIEIMAQVGDLLKKTDQGEGQKQKPSQENDKMRVRQKVLSFPVGKVFRNADLQYELGIEGSRVSEVLQAMGRDGKLKMIKRGTWEVAAL